MKNYEEQKVIERIREEYEDRELTKTEKLKVLDKKVRRPADIFAYSFGIASSLVLGTGMCLAMNVIGENLHPVVGIAVGVVGMALCGLNYLLYKAILKSRKKKYSKQVLELCDEALNGVNA